MYIEPGVLAAGKIIAANAAALAVLGAAATDAAATAAA